MAKNILPKVINYPVNAKQVYVDIANGSDTAESGRGGVLQPYQTIPAALAAIALAGPGNYVLCLAPGDYAGAPIAWPGNVSIKGAGGAGSNISHDINYTSGAGTEVLVFEGCGFGNITVDLTLGGVSLFYIFNGAIGNFTRVDSTSGAKLIQIINVNLQAYDITGNVLCYNCTMLSGGPYVVQTAGALSFQSSLVPVPVTLNGAGTMALSGCTTSPGSVFTGVGGGTVITDSSSLFGGASVAGTAVFSFSDDAANEKFTPAVPALWGPTPATVKEALDQLVSTGVGTRTSFVYQPGGVSGGNIFATWAELIAKLSSTQGPKTIYFDDSIVSPAVIPAGAYALEEVSFDNAKAGQSCAVQVVAGVTWTGLAAIKNVEIEFLNTAVVESLAQRAMFFEGATINANGSAPIWEVPVGAQFQCFKGTFLNGTVGSAIVDVLAGQTFILVLGQNSSTNNVLCITGTLTSVLLVFEDASGVFSAQSGFAGTQTETLVDNASRVAYSPADATDWVTPPTQVAQALDELATRARSVKEIITVSAGQAAAKQIDLANLANHATVVFTIQGLSGVIDTFDYQLTDAAVTTIDWNALGLDGILLAGMNVQVQYDIAA